MLEDEKLRRLEVISFNIATNANIFFNIQGPKIIALAERIKYTLSEGGKIIFFGNGGSAADAQHLAAEFVGRFKKPRSGLAALALTTDTSIITAIANDFGYGAVFERQIEALGKREDLAIGISTSGNSENVIRGLKAARSAGMETAAFTGSDGGAIGRGEQVKVDFVLQAPSNETSRIQEVHIQLGHALCELAEN